MTCYSDLPDDILIYLCRTMRNEGLPGLMKLSMVDKRTRITSLPSIFHRIFLPRRYGPNLILWDSVESSMEAILKNQALISSVRTLNFDPWVQAPPEHKIPSSLFTLLFSFPALTKLSISVQEVYLPQFRQELSGRFASGSRFPDTLCSLCIPNDGWMLLVDGISRLDSLVIQQAQSLGYQGLELDVRNLGITHPELKALQAPAACITENLEEIANALPNLTDIGLLGPIYYPDSVLNHLKCYKQLPRLKTVRFPDLMFLGLGYDPPWCGNAYISNPGLRDELHAQAKKLTRRLLKETEHVLAEDGPRLRRVIIGGLICERDANGRLQRDRNVHYYGRGECTEEDVSHDEDGDEEEEGKEEGAEGSRDINAYTNVGLTAARI